MLRNILLVVCFPMLVSATKVPSSLLKLTNTHWSSAEQVDLKIKIEKNYKIYVDSIKIAAADPDLAISSIELDEGKKIYDKFSKKDKFIFENLFEAKIVLELATQDKTNIEIALTYQACTSEFCLFPRTENIKINIPKKLIQAKDNIQKLESKNSSIDKTSKEESKAFSLTNLLQKNIFLALLACFIAGLMTSLTPCVFPMIPITLAVLTPKKNEKPKILYSILYVSGLALTYTLLGLISASTGSLFGSYMGNLWIGLFFAVFIFLMAVSSFGFFEIKSPKIFDKLLQKGSEKTNIFKPFLFGIFAGFVAGPCVGPILFAILAIIHKSQDLVKGSAMMLSFSLGMGIIFVLLSSFAAKKLPRAGAWMSIVNLIFGISLTLLSIYFANNTLSNEHLYLYICAITIILAGLFIYKTGPKILFRKLKKHEYILGGFILPILALGLSAKILLFKTNNSVNKHVSKTETNHGNWEDYSEESIKLAHSNSKPTIIDFYADWCTACKELEEKTFVDPKVKKSFLKFNLIRHDATKSTPKTQKILDKYGVFGLPTLLFFDSNGLPIKDLRLSGFERPLDFEKRLQKVLSKK